MYAQQEKRLWDYNNNNNNIWVFADDDVNPSGKHCTCAKLDAIGTYIVNGSRV